MYTVLISILLFLILFGKIRKKGKPEKKQKSKIDITGMKWIGKRKLQEDSYAVFSPSDEEHILIIADGMRGYSEGQLASQFSVNRFLDLYSRGDLKIPEIIKKINGELLNFSESLDLKNRIGTTFLVCEIILNKMRIFSVGDSSAYIVTKEYIRKINKSQNRGSYLTNYVGYEDFDEEGINVTEINSMKLETDEKTGSKKFPVIILMCSDGVDKYMETGTIKRIIEENINKTGKEITELMMNTLKEKRRLNQDNASIILIKTDNKYLQKNDVIL